MSHSLCNIWVHGIICTKHRQRLITPVAEPTIHQWIVEELINLECRLRAINGVEDHIHLLFLLNSKYALSQVFKQIKGTVSHRVNQADLIPDKFTWQTGYSAFSVSPSRLDQTELYIQKQKEHHRLETYYQEMEKIYRVHGFPLPPEF